MYAWSPWQRGDFTFAGCEIKQMKDFNVTITQVEFCNALQPVEIKNGQARNGGDSLQPEEITQFRGAVMKAQKAPQYSARVGLLSSKANMATVEDLREANRILKEMKKSSKVELLFPAFNNGRNSKLQWNEMVMLHFGDAAQNNRRDGSSTGGYITGMAPPEIMTGQEAKMSIIDWRSWRLDRATKGSNGCEAQPLYDTEDRGWKCRIMWKLMYQPFLIRGEQNLAAAAAIESLLILDSRGLYDAVTLSETSFCNMKSAKSGVEAMSIQAQNQNPDPT